MSDAKKQKKKPAASPSKRSQKKPQVTPKKIPSEIQKPEQVSGVRKPLSPAPKLFVSSLKLPLKHWNVFLGILVVYAIITASFVGGVGASNVSSLKSTFTQAFHGHFKLLTAGFSVFSVVIGSDTKNTTTAGSVYQMLFFVIMSLAIIWTLRQLYAGHVVRIRDGFYAGMYPLIPFILILLLIGLELIPLVIGGVLYSYVVGGGIAVGSLEKAGMAVVFLLFTLASVYFMSSSIFALYITTLPEMTPMRALRSARQLVRHRRWLIVRKLLFLPVALLVAGAVIIIPVALFLTPVAAILFFILALVSLGIVHCYMYALYRELL